MTKKIKDDGWWIRDSIFGWIVSGPVYSSDSKNVLFHMTKSSKCESEKNLLKFWEIEIVPESSHSTSDNRRCEEHFDSTTRRNKDRCFVLEMPLKGESNKLSL